MLKKEQNCSDPKKKVLLGSQRDNSELKVLNTMALNTVMIAFLDYFQTRRKKYKGEIFYMASCSFEKFTL